MTKVKYSLITWLKSKLANAQVQTRCHVEEGRSHVEAMLFSYCTYAHNHISGLKDLNVGGN